jgi:hypothetical protein
MEISMPTQQRGSRRTAAAPKQPIIRRIYTPFNDAELELIDRYRFGKMIADRSEAIRRAALGFLKAGRDARQ